MPALFRPALWSVLLAVAFAAPRADAGADLTPWTGGATPPLALKDLAGNTVTLSGLKGKVVLVNFWATWCAPCIEEMPELSEMAGEFSDKNIVFVGIAIDQAPNVARFIEKLPVRYPIVVAGSAGIGLVTALGNAQGGLPFTVVLGADGRIRERYLGKVPMRALRQVLTS